MVEDKKYSRVYIVEIGSEDGRIVFGSRFEERGATSAEYNISYAIVAIDAISGYVADVIRPDPNPFDGITPGV